tara:strand:- start:262 stop:1167 length:906 start_codon:yes stop_codon:yes gene_type:complete
MSELNTIESPKTAGFVDRGFNHARKKAQMEEEEKQIAQLEAEARGEEVEEDAGEATKKVAEAAPQEDTEDDSNLTREEKSFKKRYGDLRRHMQQKEKDWEEKLGALEKRVEGGTIIPPKSDEDIEAWAREYPDVAGIVETIAAKKAQEMFHKAESRLSELDKVQYEATRKSAETKILDSHPDFVKLRESDEFHDWAEEQPKWVQDAIYENQDDPASVVRVIDLYKSDKGLTKTAKKASVKNAASLVSKGSRAVVDASDTTGQISESEVSKMSSHEFEERQDEIAKAMKTGKFIYDMSGNAR